MNQGLAHLNHALCKVLGIRSKCGILPLCMMYLVSMDVSHMSGGERKEPNRFAFCMQIEALVQKLLPSSPLVHKFCMRSMAKSFQSFLAIDLMHVESKLLLRNWGTQFSAHFLSLSALLSLWTAPTHPLCVCMSHGYGGMKLLLLMYHP